jgi:hypothetical protein
MTGDVGQVVLLPVGDLASPHGEDDRSCRPRQIVVVEIPVARATPAMPPRPPARASVAAQMRRARSVKVGAKVRYFWRHSLTSTHLAYEASWLIIALIL